MHSSRFTKSCIQNTFSWMVTLLGIQCASRVTIRARLHPHAFTLVPFICIHYRWLHSLPYIAMHRRTHSVRTIFTYHSLNQMCVNAVAAPPLGGEVGWEARAFTHIPIACKCIQEHAAACNAHALSFPWVLYVPRARSHSRGWCL